MSEDYGADRGLALHYLPEADRPAMKALFALSAAMGAVLRSTEEPMIGQIRLAWWREQLEALTPDSPAPAEPRLRAAQVLLLPRGILGKDLAGLEQGWERMLDPFPWSVETTEGIWFRGVLAFGLAARILGTPNETLQQAGGVWALTDAARYCSDAATRGLLIERARKIAPSLDGARFAKRLRPLSMLGALAMRDVARGEPIEPEGTPGRAWTMLKHRITGRF
ncbi:MAG: squalene/phytoene synthase family protein [Sphingomicrobium sp.]